MKWQVVKKQSDIKLLDVGVTLELIDNVPKILTLIDKDGNQLRVRYESYSIVFEVPAKPKLEDRWFVRGTVLGLEVDECFEREFQARNRYSELSSAVSNSGVASALSITREATEINDD